MSSCVPPRKHCCLTLEAFRPTLTATIYLQEGVVVVHERQLLQLTSPPLHGLQSGLQALQAALAARRCLLLLSPDGAPQRLEASLQGVDDAHDGALAVVLRLSAVGLAHGHTMVSLFYQHTENVKTRVVSFLPPQVLSAAISASSRRLSAY